MRNILSFTHYNAETFFWSILVFACKSLLFDLKFLSNWIDNLFLCPMKCSQPKILTKKSTVGITQVNTIITITYSKAETITYITKKIKVGITQVNTIITITYSKAETITYITKKITVGITEINTIITITYNKA